VPAIRSTRSPGMCAHFLAPQPCAAAGTLESGIAVKGAIGLIDHTGNAHSQKSLKSATVASVCFSCWS
jgi:hypothetical protein